MNRPLRNEDPLDKHPTWNQSPNPLSSDGTSRQELNGIVNLRLSRDHLPRDHTDPGEMSKRNPSIDAIENQTSRQVTRESKGQSISARRLSTLSRAEVPSHKRWLPPSWQARSFSSWRTIKEFASFLGPGFLVAVAYIDPGNYATDVAAGATTEYQLLFIVFMSNVFAVVLQSLSIRLGTVTGKNLAEHCRDHLPGWLNIIIYLLAEAAIIATDLAEVCTTSVKLLLVNCY